MSRDKLKSQAGRGWKSSGESIGVHRSQSFKKSNEPSLRENPKGVNRSSQESKFKEEQTQAKSEAARVQLSPLEFIGFRVLERVTDQVKERKPKESIGVHLSKSSRISRDKLKSEAERGWRSSAEFIGVHRSLLFRKIN